jgi:hypothetical protein
MSSTFATSYLFVFLRVCSWQNHQLIMDTISSRIGRRRTAYSLLIGIILLTVPCYLLGFGLLWIARPSNAQNPFVQPTATFAAVIATSTQNLVATPTQFVPMTATTQTTATNQPTKPPTATLPPTSTPSPTASATLPPPPTETPTPIPLLTDTPAPTVPPLPSDTPLPLPTLTDTVPAPTDTPTIPTDTPTIPTDTPTPSP